MKEMKESAAEVPAVEVEEEVDTIAGEWDQENHTEEDTATKVSPMDGF